MQFHIHNKNSAPLVSREPRDDAPIHEAKSLEEFDMNHVEFAAEEPEEERGWRTSRRIPIILFCSAILLFFGITYVAKQFQSGENLQGVFVEGNASLQSSEVMSLAAIDQKQKFYDIDLRQIEQRIEKHGLVRNAVLKRETHPNRIIIHIDEREPIAMIRSLTGEPVLVDRDYKFFLPKRLSGLKDPDKLLSVPLLGGITEKDTGAIIVMAKFVQLLRSVNENSMKDAIGELRRTTTGDFVIFTTATMTPIFIGSPRDEKFETTLESDAKKLGTQDIKESLFDHQIKLLASLWQKRLKEDLSKNRALYVDARFDRQIILKRRSRGNPHTTPISDSLKSKTLAISAK